MDEATTAETPLAVLPYAPPAPSDGVWVVRFSWIAVAICWLGTACIPLISVETVLATGPALFAVALAQVIAAGVGRRFVLCLVAAGHLAICGLFIFCANAFRMGPAAAATPFLAMSFVWSILSTIATAKRQWLASLRVVGVST